VLFGWAMAELTQGNRDKAKALSDQLGRDFPASPYTARLQKNLAAAR
jgi:predicted Zn-dependent protease